MDVSSKTQRKLFCDANTSPVCVEVKKNADTLTPERVQKTKRDESLHTSADSKKTIKASNFRDPNRQKKYVKEKGDTINQYNRSKGGYYYKKPPNGERIRISKEEFQLNNPVAGHKIALCIASEIINKQGGIDPESEKFKKLKDELNSPENLTVKTTKGNSERKEGDEKTACVINDAVAERKIVKWLKDLNYELKPTRDVIIKVKQIQNALEKNPEGFGPIRSTLVELINYVEQQKAKSAAELHLTKDGRLDKRYSRQEAERRRAQGTKKDGTPDKRTSKGKELISKTKNVSVKTSNNTVIGTHNGDDVYQVPRGGQYRVNDTGKKTYLKEKIPTPTKSQPASRKETTAAAPVKTEVNPATETLSSRIGTHNGDDVYQGPRGGQYRVNDTGKKTYLKEKIPTSTTYSSSNSTNSGIPYSASCSSGSFLNELTYLEPSYELSSSSSLYSSGTTISTYSSSGSANGRTLNEGPRGGTFYFTSSGNKRYV
eukprot:gene5183-7027_t